MTSSFNNNNKENILNNIQNTLAHKRYNILEPSTLLEFIDKNLKPNIGDKEDFGEVLTPFSLVNNMLDELDEAYYKCYNKTIFSVKEFKWFDPAVGIGNFPIILYYRLMEGLKKQIINDEKRRTHILENMLYVSELTQKNVFIYKKIFCDYKYKLNIYEGDTLKMDIIKDFKLPTNFVGFDVVLGNPPYNANGTKHKGDKNIYVYFSEKTLITWLRPSGFLLYIHPPVYRIPNHKIQQTKINLNELYTTKKICCIKMYSINETLKLMYVMINVDFIIIHNTNNDLLTKSKIIDTTGTIYYIVIKPNDFIPNFGLNIMKKIKSKCSFGNISLILNSEIHAQKISGSKYKNIHGITKKGIKICMSNKKYTYYNTPKLIINGIGSYNYVYYDKYGKYGITQSPIGIINPSQNTIQLIESSLFHFIVNATKIIGNNFNIKTSLYLPIIPETIKIKNINDLYKFFDFTKDEIIKINKYSIPSYENTELSCDGKMKITKNKLTQKKLIKKTKKTKNKKNKN